MRKSRSFSLVMHQGLEAIYLNIHYLHGRWRLARSDQARRRRIHRHRPDIDRGTLRRYPFREPLPLRLRVLYRGIIRDTQRVLGTHHNPFALPPSVFFGYEPEGPAHYNAARHEILLSHEFQYWYRLVGLYFLTMHHALEEACRDPRCMPWNEIVQHLLKRGATYEELIGMLEQHFFADLLPAWRVFVAQLPSLLAECERTEHISEALLTWYESLEQLHSMLERQFRWLIIHEYLHAQTKWVTQRIGKEQFRLVGVIRLKTHASSTSLPLQHHLLNEALTEWMALRFYRQMTGESLQMCWGELAWGSAYPAWIIEYVAQALDSQWETLSQTFPALRGYGLRNTAELLFQLLFGDPGGVRLFKDVVAHVGRRPDAFERVSVACEWSYHVSDEQSLAQQQAAFQELSDLFAWTFPESTRQVLASVAAADFAEMLRFAQTDTNASLPAPTTTERNARVGETEKHDQAPQSNQGASVPN